MLKLLLPAALLLIAELGLLLSMSHNMWWIGMTVAALGVAVVMYDYFWE